VKTGELKLSAKNLRDFPKHGERYNLRDTVLADLSRNRLVEVPAECTCYHSLERLLLYHNTIKTIPDNIISLNSLMYLDISRNQLSYLPASVCSLINLQCLVANNNKLVSLPEEIGEMTNLMELDVSCNEIAHLPVQIGDLSNLRSLHLRRNHLQEVPVEISYLQLTFLDLAGNRLSSLPVELRFMVTLCDLHLEENPLTCPPANLCGRGRVHIFKYLEIQAIKEDKKRGVLTDGEYRRSYRKTSQLNDMRFGLSADARRKRNTADSGYGSEQPLDRRWSQEFSQEAEAAHQQAEDARRLAHRAISYRPASHSNLPAVPMIKPMMLPPAPTRSPHHPSLSSHASTSSSGVSSLQSYRADSSTSPTSSLDMMTSLTIQENIKNGNTSHDVVDGKTPNNQTAPFSSLPPDVSGSVRTEREAEDGESLARERAESEERRRTAQRVFSKQGSHSRPVGRLPLPTSSNTKTALTKSSPSSPNSSGLPTPPQGGERKERSISSIQTYRQFKEQQRLARQEDRPASHVSYRGEQKIAEPGMARTTFSSVSNSNKFVQKQSVDIKSVQKEAVMSYLDRMNAGGPPAPRAGSAGAPPDIAPPPPPSSVSPRHSVSQLNGSNQKTTSIPTVSRALPTSTSRTRFTGSSSSSSLPAPSSQSPGVSQYQGNQAVNFTQRREAERAAVQDSHIHHLRQQIENRLKVSLGEDLAAALADGVVLCHIANHVSPRAVSSIHVPSPAVPKLTGAKCRRNVDNFLSACRKIGVREDLICQVTDIMEPKKTNTVRVAITVTELLRYHVPRNNQTINI